LFREVVSDSTRSEKLHPSVINVHIINLDAWHSSIPKTLSIENSSVEAIQKYLMQVSERDRVTMVDLPYQAFCCDIGARLQGSNEGVYLSVKDLNWLLFYSRE
jgi:hypothetical protein